MLSMQWEWQLVEIGVCSLLPPLLAKVDVRGLLCALSLGSLALFFAVLSRLPRGEEVFYLPFAARQFR